MKKLERTDLAEGHELERILLGRARTDFAEGHELERIFLAGDVTWNAGNSATAPISFISRERYRQKHALQLVLLCENRSSRSCYPAKTVRYSQKKCVTTRVTLQKKCVTAFSL